MKISSTNIPDLLIIEPSLHKDDRGYFFESFRQDLLENFIGHKIQFCQDNQSLSSKNTLRGLHFQKNPKPQTKLVSVSVGSILDVAVDIRRKSKTFGMHIIVELSGENKKQLFIPRGFAHGFLVKSDYAIVQYKVDNYFDKNLDSGISYSDPFLSIDWGVDFKKLNISDKDLGLPNLNEEGAFFDSDISLYD